MQRAFEKAGGYVKKGPRQEETPLRGMLQNCQAKQKGRPVFELPHYVRTAQKRALVGNIEF